MEITIVNAATLVCLRERRAPVNENDGASPSSSSWEVLLGQSEVKNWLRSTDKLTRIMRYPGEWKFPGGVVDDCDTSLEATALRELQEEFAGIPVTQQNARMYFFLEKLTRPIQRKRHRMFNFVAFEDENMTWMSDDAIAVVNATLAEKRATFEASYLADGSFWRMSDDEKMRVSPEIHRVQWFPIATAMEMMQDTLVDPYTPLDDWQKQEFDRYGVAKRDPMYITLRVLQEISEIQPSDALREQVKRTRAPGMDTVLALNSSL
ncbi:3-mercaptopyruvate sulfurtransferase, partial [Globisporangium splendens]